MKQVIVFPRGQLTKADKERMSKAGIVAVEADDPSKVVAVLPNAPLLTGDDILMSALKAICETSSYGSKTEAMLSEMNRRAKVNEGQRTTESSLDSSRDKATAK